VASQSDPNGQFPNVTKSPNPEVPECMDRAEAVAREHRAHLVIATDPDADRLGGLACTTIDGSGDYRFLSGQELCALLTHFKLSSLARNGSLPPNPLVITTEVTTGILTRIARQFGIQIVNNLLVGFKYHADVLKQLETNGRFDDVTGTPDDLILACEESHGIMGMPGVRDKDSAAAVLLLAELALTCKRQGKTIVDYLDDLSRQFGYFKNGLENLVMTGIEGKQNMAKMLDALRANPPQMIAGMDVVQFEDLRDENGRMGPFRGDTDKAARNFLIFRLQGDHGIAGKVCLRPSGTEPKAKAYIEVSGPPRPVTMTEEVWQAQRQHIDRTMAAVGKEFVQLAMSLAK
jgi:phosphoglucomutase/phosphomannomutase